MTTEQLKEIIENYPTDAKVAIGWVSHCNDYAGIVEPKAYDVHYASEENTLYIDIVIE